MAIGVDVDEVLLPTLSYCCTHLNAKYGGDLKPEDFSSYKFWEFYNMTREDTIRFWIEFSGQPEFGSLQPFPEAQEGIARLKRTGRSLLAVTSRPACNRDCTESWLERYFPGMFSGVEFANHFSLEGEVVSKLEICKSNGVGVLIEDICGNAIDVAREIPVVLFRRPWNKQLQEGGNIYVANNWGEIVERTEQILS